MSVPSHRLPPRAPRPDGYTEWGTFAQPRRHRFSDSQHPADSGSAPGDHDHPFGRARRRRSPRRLLLGATLLIAVIAVLITGVAWPGWLVVDHPTPAGPPPPAATAQPGTTADALLAALRRHDATAVTDLTCASGVAARKVARQLLTTPGVRFARVGKVDTTAAAMALVQLVATGGGVTSRYTGILARVNGHWCVTTLSPDSVAGPAH